MLIICRPDFEGKIRSAYVEICDKPIFDTDKVSKFAYADYTKEGTVVGIELVKGATKTAIERAFKVAIEQSPVKQQLRGIRKTVTQIFVWSVIMAKQYPFEENFQILSRKYPSLVNWITAFDLSFDSLPEDVCDDFCELERAIQLREAVETVI